MRFNYEIKTSSELLVYKIVDLKLRNFNFVVGVSSHE